MRIVNVSRGVCLAEDADMRDTADGRRKGLMDSPKADIVLDVGGDSRIRSMIHMFHMRYPIDVIWVSESMEAVDVRRGVVVSSIWDPRTWFSTPKRPARYVVELGRGGVGDTKEGDNISFEGCV